MRREKFLIFILIQLFLVSSLYSGIDGKISGYVKDDEGDPLAEANITLMGTNLGAVTDEEGYFYIIGVRVGNYKLKCEYVGFGDYTTDVKVKVSNTAKKNIVMKSEDYYLPDTGVIVGAVFEVDAGETGPMRPIDTKKLERMAVTEVDAVLSNTIGMTTDAEGDMHLRGGRTGEISFIIEGMPVGDPTVAKKTPKSINFANVESFEIKPGVPEAEYGNALSGNVTVVYKIGDQEKTNGYAKYETDSFMGDNKFNLHSGEFSISGPLSFFGLKMNPTYYIATDLSMQDGFAQSYRVNGEDNGDYIDYEKYDLTGLGFKLPSGRENNFNIISKVAYDFSEVTSATLTFNKGKSHNYEYTWNNKFSPETAAETIEDITSFNINFKQVLNKNSFYDVIFSYYNRKYERLPGGNRPDEMIPEGSLDIFNGADHSFDGNAVRDGGDCEGFVDNNRNGYFDREYFTDNPIKVPTSFVGSDTTWVDFYNSNWDRDFDFAGYHYDAEEFTDANGNGVYDGDRLFDSNQNGEWDYWETGNSYSGFFSDGEENVLSSIYIEGYIDNNFDGHFANFGIYRVDNNDEFGDNEPFKDGDVFKDTGEPFIDQMRYALSDNGIDVVLLANLKYSTAVSAINLDYNLLKDITFDGKDFTYWLNIYDGVVYNISNDSLSITIHYPDEDYIDLKSSYGSVTQPNLRYNFTYDIGNFSGVDGNDSYSWDFTSVSQEYLSEFDEFEAYCSYRPYGSAKNPEALGWVSGMGPNDASTTVKYIGSYTIYEAPRAEFDNPTHLDNLNINQYSTWVDNNSNGYYDKANGSFDSGEYFVDYNSDGVQNDGSGFLDPGNYANTTYMNLDNSVYKLKTSYTNQVDKYNLLKTGFEFTYNQLKYYMVTKTNQFYNTESFPVHEDDPYPTLGESKTYYDYQPLEFSYYVQDKMEFEDLVVSAGLRFDMRRLDDDSADDYEELRASKTLGYEDPLEQTVFAVSPRFGISHSISETSKLFFTYGHLYQLPTYTQVFDPNTKADQGSVFGNMNLSYERNVQYELGVQNQYGDYLIDVSAYFKDVYDMINIKTYKRGTQKATTYFNSDYGKTRGIELKVDKNLKNNYLWGLSYAFAYAYGKASSALGNFDPEVNENKKIFREFPLDFDERHTISTYVTILYGKGDELFDIDYLDNWSLSVDASFGSGTPFTPTESYYWLEGTTIPTVLGRDIEDNSERLPYTINTDLKVSKTFSFEGGEDVSYGDLKFEFSVYNLFDRINVTRVYASSGNWYEDKEELAENSGKEDYYRNITNIAERRHYKFGVSYTF